MLLQSGDTVNVDTGTMTLRLDEDKYVYAEENTEFSIEAAGNSKEGRTTIELKKGAIVNEIRQKLGEGSSYEVNTPNATMSVRGTTFRVEVTYDQNGTCYTRITVTDGKVVTRLKYEDGSVAEEEVAVEKDGEVIIYRDSTTTDYVKDNPGEDAGETTVTKRQRQTEPMPAPLHLCTMERYSARRRYRTERVHQCHPLCRRKKAGGIMILQSLWSRIL